MKILAVEFSPPQRSVAVVQTGAGESAPLVSEVIETGPGVTRTLDLVEEALRRAGLEREQIECLAIGLGPGSYTGIRMAIALAQGWQLAARPGGIKLLGISSAEGVAAQARAEGLSGSVNVVIDAQRNEFYLARYEIVAQASSPASSPGVPPGVLPSGETPLELAAGTAALRGSWKGWREVEPLRLATFAEVQARERAGEVLIGPEVTRWFPAGRLVVPRAETLGRLALERNDFVAGEKLVPIYLRETTFVKAPPPRKIA